MTRAASTASPTVLTIVEAVELSTAWLQSLAQSHGVRLLVLKGDALRRQGLRDSHVSSDADVLIEPERFEDFVRAVTSAGWDEYADSFANRAFVLHSRTYRRSGWPNSIDIHSSWPGFLKSNSEVFELLWERRESFEFAHATCWTPDRNANLLLLALHSLRGTSAQLRHQRELEAIKRMNLGAEDRQDLALLSQALGASAALHEVLGALDILVEVEARDLESSAYKEWQRKVAHAQGRTASWLIELQRAPWRRKAVVLRHGVWPTDHDLLAEHPDVPDRFWAKIWARIARLGGGLRQLRRVIPALRRR